ncbi:helix-turn-helix domain-containing protein [Desulfosporosinus youngiae]|nr:AraC family transcriptional regulator [Desulfosporosinus youngiae]
MSRENKLSGVGFDMRPEIINFSNGIPIRAFIWNSGQYPYHWHNAVEIIYVMEGSVNIKIGAETHLLKENNVAVINVDEIHGIAKDPGDNKVLFIQIDPAFCEKVLPDFKYTFFYCSSIYHEAVVPEKYHILKGYLARLVGEINKGSQAVCKKDIESSLQKMLIYLAYNFDFIRWGMGTEALDEKLVKRIKQMYEYAAGHYSDKMGLKDLTELVSIGVHHMSHFVTEKFGKTFQDLLNYSRGEQAARLLLGTDKRILDISLECGFSDPKYLIKYFKSNYQCTPLQFRRMYRAEDKTLASQIEYQDYPLSEASNYLEPYINAANSLD